MKMPVRILLVILCAALILALPFVVSSPNMLNDVKMELMNDGEDEIDFGRLLFSAARAEEDELEVETVDEGDFSSHPDWALPLDFSVPPAPQADLYTSDGYEDETIRVKLEHRKYDEGTTIHIAYIEISDPSQIRTAVANPEKLASTKTMSIKAFAKKYNAVIAMSGDNYNTEASSKPLVFRMTKQIRNKMKSDKRDVLIIDDRGEFHVTVRSLNEVKEVAAELKSEGRQIVNAYSFGPTLVKDGAMVELNPHYFYNPGGREPRAAIGQTGPLSYVMVVVEAQDRSGSSGLSHEKLAELMLEIGCQQAYNLDGGNSAEMVFGEQIYKGMPHGDERGMNDAIYFATMQP